MKKAFGYSVLTVVYTTLFIYICSFLKSFFEVAWCVDMTCETPWLVKKYQSIDSRQGAQFILGLFAVLLSSLIMILILKMCKLRIRKGKIFALGFTFYTVLAIVFAFLSPILFEQKPYGYYEELRDEINTLTQPYAGVYPQTIYYEESDFIIMKIPKISMFFSRIVHNPKCVLEIWISGNLDKAKLQEVIDIAVKSGLEVPYKTYIRVEGDDGNINTTTYYWMTIRNDKIVKIKER